MKERQNLCGSGAKTEDRGSVGPRMDKNGSEGRRIDRINDVGDNKDQVNMIAGLLRCDDLVEPPTNYCSMRYILEERVWREVGMK